MSGYNNSVQINLVCHILSNIPSYYGNSIYITYFGFIVSSIGMLVKRLCLLVLGFYISSHLAQFRSAYVTDCFYSVNIRLSNVYMDLGLFKKVIKE